MAQRYLTELLTPAERNAQKDYYGRAMPESPTEMEASPSDALTANEVAFIGRRDSVYLATVSESGWPYIQHRGGPPGFLRVLDPSTLAFADLKGNRQLLTTGNVQAND